MHSTRRLLDRYSFTAALCLVACGGAASCSSPDDGGEPAPVDAGTEASATGDGGAPPDGGSPDATTPDVAPPPFDGGPLPVVCAAAPCATSLVTTLASDASDLGEGYCVLLRDGTVACWGANGAGQLGRGDNAGTADNATAERVVGLSDVEELSHTCAVDKSGGAWCWGTGPYLRDDAGARTTERAPIKLALPPVKHLGMGIDVGCASNDDGVVCWGSNAKGQLAPLTTTPAYEVLPPRSIQLPSGAPVREVFVGATAFLLREDGQTLSWGASPSLARLSSLSPDSYPLPIVLSGISSMDATRDNACATVSGVGYCWGYLVRNPIGYFYETFGVDMDTGDSTLPQPVVAPEPLVQIATTRSFVTGGFFDAVVRPQRWCAVGASGTVYCWGFNASGQAGDGTKLHAYQAVKVEGLPTTAAQVKAMPDSTCALLTNGKVYCWGANYYGQLGNGKIKVRSLVPEEVVLP